MIDTTETLLDPDFTFNIEGKLNRACHITIVMCMFREGESVPFGVCHHRAPLVPGDDGVWHFSPHPINSVTGKPFEFPDGYLDWLRKMIEEEVGKFGLADPVELKIG